MINDAHVWTQYEGPKTLYGKACPLCQGKLLGNDYHEGPPQYCFVVACTKCYTSNVIRMGARPELTWSEYRYIGYDQAISGIGTEAAVPAIVI